MDQRQKEARSWQRRNRCSRQSWLPDRSTWYLGHWAAAGNHLLTPRRKWGHIKEVQVWLREYSRTSMRERVRRCQCPEVGDIKAAGVAAAHGNLAVPVYIPGETYVWTDIVIVHVVDATDSLAHLDQTAAGNEIGFEIVSVSHGSVDVVPEPVTDGQPRFYFPVVLQVKAYGVLSNVPVRVPKTAVRDIGLTQQQLFDVVLYRVACIDRRVIAEVAQRHTSAGVIARAVRIGTLEIAAELDIVITLHPGEVFRPV